MPTSPGEEQNKNEWEETLECWHIPTLILGQVGEGWRKRSQGGNSKIQKYYLSFNLVIRKTL